MNKTLLIIQSYRDHKPLVDMVWPQHALHGWPIFGITPEDSDHAWKPDIFHCAMIGKGGYIQPDVIKRWVRTWEIVTTEEKFSEFTDFCMVESDSVFLRKPEPHPGGLLTKLSGGAVGGASKASRFFHCVWWADRETAKIIVEEGKKLMAEGEFELNSPDLFLGLITDRRPEIKVSESNTWSCNGNDLQNRMHQCEAAVKAGAYFVHGLRTRKEYDHLLSLCS